MVFVCSENISNHCQQGLLAEKIQIISPDLRIVHLTSKDEPKIIEFKITLKYVHSLSILLLMISITNSGKAEGRPRIANIVATGRFPKSLDIVKIFQEIDFPLKEYEPETYPALLLKVKVNNNLRHVTLYRNGKYIITGASSEKDVNDIYKVIYDILSDAGYF
jgi:hypothetical protein